MGKGQLIKQRLFYNKKDRDIWILSEILTLKGGPLEDGWFVYKIYIEKPRRFCNGCNDKRLNIL